MTESRLAVCATFDGNADQSILYRLDKQRDVLFSLCGSLEFPVSDYDMHSQEFPGDGDIVKGFMFCFDGDGYKVMFRSWWALGEISLAVKCEEAFDAGIIETWARSMLGTKSFVLQTWKGGEDDEPEF